MLTEILSLLLDVASGLLAGACLLRLYMQWTRAPFGHPLGQLLFVLTNWLVLPLRRVLPAMGRVDTASLVAAWLIELAHYGLLMLLTSRVPGAGAWLVLGTFGLLRLACSGVTALLLVYVVMSWLRSDSPMADVVDRLVAPMLAPIRRVLPLMGGFDMAPLALVVMVQIAQIVLEHTLRGVLRLL